MIVIQYMSKIKNLKPYICFTRNRDHLERLPKVTQSLKSEIYNKGLKISSRSGTFEQWL